MRIDLAFSSTIVGTLEAGTVAAGVIINRRDRCCRQGLMLAVLKLIAVR